MNIRPQNKIIARAVFVLAAAAVLGWLLFCAAAWLVHHDSINYRLRDAGFEFVSNAAETVFALGPFGAGIGGLLFGAPSIVLCMRQVSSIFRTAAVNILAACIFVCGLGSTPPLLFTGFLLAGPLLWITAVIWAATRPGQTAQPAAPPNGGPAMPVGNSGVTEGPPSVS